MRNLKQFEDAVMQNSQEIQGQFYGWGRCCCWGGYGGYRNRYDVSTETGKNGVTTTTWTFNDNFNSNPPTYSYSRTDTGFNATWFYPFF